jgi:hypothetical protein
MRCHVCGTREKVRPIIGPRGRRFFLCGVHTREHYKAKRRAECSATLREYGDVGRLIGHAEAHHVALRAETLGGAAAPVVEAFLTAVRDVSVRYFAEFEAQAYRVFPSYRDRQRARGHKVRAAEKLAHSLPVDVPWLRRVYRDRCVYCAAKSEHIDHLWPLAGGGDDAPWNLAPACSACNWSKGAKPLRLWLPEHLAQLAEPTRAELVALWTGLTAA